MSKYTTRKGIASALAIGYSLFHAASSLSATSGYVKVERQQDIFKVGSDKLSLRSFHETESRAVTTGVNQSSLSAISRISLSATFQSGTSTTVNKPLSEIRATGTLEEKSGNVTATNKDVYFRVLAKDIARDSSTSLSDPIASIAKSQSRDFFSDSGSLKVKDFTNSTIDNIVGDTSVAYSVSVKGIVSANNIAKHSKTQKNGDTVNNIESELSLIADLQGQIFGQLNKSFGDDNLDISVELPLSPLMSGEIVGRSSAHSQKHGHEAAARTLTATAYIGASAEFPKVAIDVEGEYQLVTEVFGFPATDTTEIDSSATLWDRKILDQHIVLNEKDEEYFGATQPPSTDGPISAFTYFNIVDPAVCTPLQLDNQGGSSSNNYFEQTLCKNDHRKVGSGLTAYFATSAGQASASDEFVIRASSTEPAASANKLGVAYHDLYWGYSLSVGENLAPLAKIHIQAKTYTKCGGTDWKDVYKTVPYAKVFALNTQKLMYRDVPYSCLTGDATSSNRIVYRVRYDRNGQTGPWAYLPPIWMRQD